MKLSLIREYNVNDKTVELLFEIDDEFINDNINQIYIMQDKQMAVITFE